MNIIVSRVRDLMTLVALKYFPNSMFVPIYAFYTLLRSEKDKKKKIKKVKDGWLIRYGDLALLSPTPKCLPITLAEFEAKFERFFKIKAGETALDIGTCYGDTTIPMAMKVGPKGTVIAVEPEPTNVKYLRLNLGRFRNVEIIEKAVWNEVGSIRFHLHAAPTGHSILPIKESKKGIIDIPADTLDNLFSGRKVDFVKIDVQGAEVQVLDGGGKFLSTVPKLIVETHYRTDPTLRTYPKVIDILRRYRYKVNFTMDNGLVYAQRSLSDAISTPP